MPVHLQALLLAAFALLERSGGAPTPHHTWLPLSEWGQSEPALSSWDYFGLGNTYPLQPRIDPQPSWLPQPAATPTFEIVRSYRKPSIDPSSWAQIPVIGGGRENNRVFVALVPRGFEDFVLVRKPFVIVEEEDEDSKDKDSKDKDDKKGTKDKKSGSKDGKKSKDDKNSSDESDDSTDATEPSSTTKRPSTTMRSTTTTTTTTTTSTTPSTPPADDAENAAAMDDDSQPEMKNNPQK